MKKSSFIVLTLLIIFSLNLLVIADEIELKDPWFSEKPQGVYGGTLITSEFGTGPRTFNTILAKETSSTAIINNYVFEGLVGIDAITTEIIPELARDWEVADDGKTWTFYLRRGVQWSDGVEFTADDVIFTLDVIYDENIPTSARDVLIYDGKPVTYRKLDKYTVEIITPVVTPSLLYNLPSIIPEHRLFTAWKEGRFNTTWGIDTDPREIVGTGPFTIAQYRPGERVIMLRNSKYWRKAPDGKSLPYIARWVRQIVDSNETQLLMFENGDIHTVTVPARDYERIKASAEAGNYEVISGGATFSTDFVIFNMNLRNPKLEEEPWKYEWFNNINFRRAVAYATDKSTMIDQAVGGNGQPQWSPISIPNKAFLNENVKKYPYNLDKAREELQKGGFSWNDQGNLIDKDGRVVDFTMVTNAGNSRRETIMNILATDLSELGMAVHSTPIEFNKLVNQLVSEWDFDTIILGLTGGVEPNNSANVWLSSGNLHMWNPVQEKPATEWESRIDELFRKGASTVNIEERKKYYHEFQEIVAENVPIVYTIAREEIFAVYNNLKNTEPSAYAESNMGGGTTWNAYELYFE